jgi:heterodisulfide reductase subunit C
VEKYGRVQETSLMPGYFLKKRDPLLPLHYLPLGVRMMRAGKLHVPDGSQKGRLKALFAKVREMEDQS